MSGTPAWVGEWMWGEERRWIPRYCWLAYQLIGSRSVRKRSPKSQYQWWQWHHQQQSESNRGSHLSCTHKHTSTYTFCSGSLAPLPPGSKLLRATVARGTSQVAATRACQLCVHHSVMDWEASKSSTHSEEIHRRFTSRRLVVTWILGGRTCWV